MANNESVEPKNMSYEESQSDKLARKAKEAPFVPLGLAGLALACAYGAYRYKHRGGMSTSVFLMQLRVAAQGTVVSCLVAGLAYKMAKEYLFSPKTESPEGTKDA